MFQRGPGRGSGGPPGENVPDGQCEVQLLIHESQAGAVIGRQGSKVKELREVALQILNSATTLITNTLKSNVDCLCLSSISISLTNNQRFNISVKRRAD